MQAYQTICICGGGSLGHTVAASISHKGYQVNLLTGHPSRWSHHIQITDCNNQIINGEISVISDNPKEVIPSSDIVLLCLPGYLIQSTLRSIAPFLRPETEVGSVICSSGFFWMAQHELGNGKKLFGFQRVPFISRVTKYGEKAELKGYKSLLKIGGSKSSNLQALSSFFTDALSTPTITLHHYLEATLTNSNPILHPSRIFGMLSDHVGDLYDREYLFYEECDEKSSEVLIQCDTEFQQIVNKLPIHQDEIPCLLDYYESTDVQSLTQKIRSIQAFKGIKMCMIPQENGQFAIDYSNRYFTEDIPYGLLIIKSLGLLLEVPTPTIDQVIYWTQEHMGKCYLVEGQLTGKDIKESGVVSNYQIHSLTSLLNL